MKNKNKKTYITLLIKYMILSMLMFTEIQLKTSNMSNSIVDLFFFLVEIIVLLLFLNSSFNQLKRINAPKLLQFVISILVSLTASFLLAKVENMHPVFPQTILIALASVFLAIVGLEGIVYAAYLIFKISMKDVEKMKTALKDIRNKK
ncbi:MULTISPECIES: hypothetical protein [Liquorilactobacillus]|uniref:hypothetical protein n=1 Tax=Liquorilactobacillus TaxID=2767888 RepID=UPI001CBFEEAE|nr:hypothetical protein [Liquorilactobacillus hordei]MBZ2406642.1 hypothetical protein [Liquorilactobacillus hordei]